MNISNVETKLNISSKELSEKIVYENCIQKIYTRFRDQAYYKLDMPLFPDFEMQIARRLFNELYIEAV